MANELDEQLFTDYELIVSKIADLESLKKDKRAEVLKALSESNIGTLKRQVGTYSVVPRSTYVYNDEAKSRIKLVKDKVKVAEQKEIFDGNAEKQETESLRFLPKK